MYFSFNVLDIITFFENNQPVVSCSCLTFLLKYIFVVLMLVSYSMPLIDKHGVQQF